MDIFTKAKRSEVMAAVRPKGNRSTELRLAKALRRHGLKGWRRHQKIYLGDHTTRPDFIFPLKRVAIFVDGCFFHCCPLHGTKPASRRAYWLPKLAANRRRDRRISVRLRRNGWKVIRIWEHSLRNDIDRCVGRISRAGVP